MTDDDIRWLLCPYDAREERLEEMAREALDEVRESAEKAREDLRLNTRNTPRIRPSQLADLFQNLAPVRDSYAKQLAAQMKGYFPDCFLQRQQMMPPSVWEQLFGFRLY